MKNYFSHLYWLRNYSLGTLRADAFAGVTLTAYAIPVSLAYSTLAGLPPQYGVFGYFLGGLFYALLGTSRQLAIGPTSAISMLIGASLSTLSGGDTQRWLDLASLTALMVSGICVLAYLLRLSSIINFISETILVGFKAGAALLIASTQLPKLFGVTGGGSDFFTRIVTLIIQLPQTNIYVLAFGILAIGLIFIGEKIFRGKPIAFIVVVLSILIFYFITPENFGFATVGIIPAGLPPLHFPLFNLMDIQNTASLAFACFLLTYIESISAAKAIAQKHNYEIGTRQELLALGIANLATAFGNGYPVSGGLSQTAVNDGAGAKTPMALVATSFWMGVCLLFFTGLLKNLPNVTLAAIVMVAISGLMDWKELNRMRRVNKPDFLIALTAMLSVIFFGILNGVLIGAVVSLILIIKKVSSPHIAFLGKIPGTDRYTDMDRHPDNELLPGVILFRVESPLVYFNTSYIYNHVWPKIDESPTPLKVVIFDLSTSAYIDSSGAKLVKRLFEKSQEKGIIFKVAEAHSAARDILRFEDVAHLLGHVSRRDSIHDVIAHSLTLVETEIRENEAM